MNPLFRKTLSLASAALMAGVLAFPAAAAEGMANPCAPKNPCVAKMANPCDMAKAKKAKKKHKKMTNPCATKAANPCAAKPANPCATKQ